MNDGIRNENWGGHSLLAVICSFPPRNWIGAQPRDTFVPATRRGKDYYNIVPTQNLHKISIYIYRAQVTKFGKNLYFYPVKQALIFFVNRK